MSVYAAQMFHFWCACPIISDITTFYTQTETFSNTCDLITSDEYICVLFCVHHSLPAFHHIGIYAYRNSFLKRYGKLNKPKIEIYEKLEQLRIIWNGYSIACLITSREIGQGIDTKGDLEEVNRKNIK